MGYQVIRQPDGLYAVFSSYTDTIAVWSTSGEEIVEWFAEIAAERARTDARRVLEHVAAGEPKRAYFQFVKTWEEALASDREHGGNVWSDPDLPAAGGGEPQGGVSGTAVDEDAGSAP